MITRNGGDSSDLRILRLVDRRVFNESKRYIHETKVEIWKHLIIDYRPAGASSSSLSLSSPPFAFYINRFCETNISLKIRKSNLPCILVSTSFVVLLHFSSSSSWQHLSSPAKQKKQINQQRHKISKNAFVASSPPLVRSCGAACTRCTLAMPSFTNW